MQANSIVVFLIDDSGNVRWGGAPARIQGLKDGFRKLLAKYRDPADNVRVAALMHGVTRTYDRPINDQEQRDLGGRRGGPYIFSPDPDGPGPFSIDPAAPFKALDQLTDTMVTDAIDLLVMAGGDALTYAGIDLAREAIISECPTNVDLTLKPWCHRKVIVVLSGGDPGWGHSKYYATNPKLPGELPEKLLDDVKDAGIKLDTICLAHYDCDEMFIIRFHIDYVHRGYRCARGFCPPREGDDYTCLGYRGGDVMRELAERTGGTFYGFDFYH